VGPRRKYKSSSLLESMPARVKLKRVGGVLYMNWKLRLNSIQHGETYQSLGAGEPCVGSAWRSHRGLCMATTSRWSDFQVKSVNRRDPGAQFSGWAHRTRKCQAGGSKVGLYVPNVLGGPRLTMPHAGRGVFEGGRRSAKCGVVGIGGCNGPHEPGTSCRRGSSSHAE